MYLTEGVLYEIESTLVEYTGAAKLMLSWSYPGQAKINIPSTAYYSDQQYVDASPYFVTVTCPIGYHGDTLVNPIE